MTASKPLLIGVVGPCGSGKSTLTEALDRLGYSTRHIAQEHSYVKDMWLRLTNPDVLIFLQASFPTTRERKKKMIHWTQADYEEQQRRLSHALAHADLILDTDPLSIQDVLEQTLAFIGESQAK
jgi:deoxyadenosine/deoxycytidine kinase